MATQSKTRSFPVQPLVSTHIAKFIQPARARRVVYGFVHIPLWWGQRRSKQNTLDFGGNRQRLFPGKSNKYKKLGIEPNMKKRFVKKIVYFAYFDLIIFGKKHNFSFGDRF